MQEFENNVEKKENQIKTILEKTENDIKEGKITRRSNQDGAEEFVFSGNGTGLVFDKELPEEQKKQEPVDSHIKNAPRVEEVTLISRSENAPLKVDPPVEDREFLIPTTFRVDEKYNTPSVVEERRTMYATYVPKFTDASENYRMAGETQPKKETEATEAEVEPTAEAEESVAIDPTAETEVETEGAVIVDVAGASAEVEEAVLNVSKPAAPEPAPQAEPMRTVEDEKAEIESLLFTQAAAKQEKPAESEASAIFEAPMISEMPVLPEVPALPEEPVASAVEPAATPSVTPQESAEQPYAMPDPDEGKVRILDYPEELTNVSVPAEIDVAPLPAQGKLFSQKEYVNVGQKLAFKDMFLDRLNSVKVRLSIALILTLVLCALENMHLLGLDALSLLGFRSYPFVLAFLDIQFVGCLLFLSAPEILRGVRALTKGLFHSELFIPVAFLLQILHTVAVMTVQGSSGRLYGFVFGIFAVATIFGSYLRHHAAFLTFRHVGGGEEKFAVEKRTTRTLEKEKFALDGAVDEYKSKTARVVRASFIADFFARERKSAENTRHNLKLLLISLGVSLVAAIVMFFLGDGMISAATTLTVTFYLCMPAALLLAHRLPYYLSVRKASMAGGGVIGETSHYDYAGVDVVSFKDTEIFRKGDVALKHIILYDAAKEFTAVVEQMSSLFSVIGGPLDVLFSETLVKKCPPADEAILEENGIFGRIGDAVLHVGNAKYMISKGIALPKEKDNRESVDESTVVMYAAENGRIYAKFYLQYRLSPEYKSLLSSFADEKIVSLVYTSDYNLTLDLLRYLAGGRDLIRVIRDSSVSQNDELQERVSVGLVSSKNKMSAFSLLLLCRRYVEMQKNLMSAFWFTLGAGAFLGAMLAVFNLIALPSLVYGLLEVVLVGAMAIYVKKTLDKTSTPGLGGSEKK